MDNLPKSTTDLLQRIEQEWAQLLAVLGQLTVEEVITPHADGWTVKDHLAHLNHWQQWLLRHHIQGEPAKDVLQVDPVMLEEFEVDRINEVILQRNRTRTLDDVLHEFHETHAQVVKTLTQLPFDKLLQPRYADDPERRPLLLWVIGDTYEHYQEHRAALQS